MPVRQDAPPTGRETAWFIGLTLPIAWGLAAIWLHDPSRWRIIQWVMCTPALVGFALAFWFRREPPRAVGFAYTGWGPWVAAFLYPLAMAGCIVGLAYATRAATGDASFIHFQPAAVGFRRFGLARSGLAAIPPRLTWIAVLCLPAFLVAVAYRLRWPERVQAALPPRLRFLHHGLRALLFAQVIWFFPGPLAPPGSYGEEMGWRGYLVRRWASRPLVAAAITAPVWAAFHIPVVFATAQRGNLLQNAFFLASIAAAAVPFVALYLWARSIWPCAVLHLTWNFWNPFFLGDVYGGAPGMFGGRVWIFNGEGAFGLLVNGAVAAALLWRWRAAAASGTRLAAAQTI